MKKIHWERLVPLGLDAGQELRRVLLGLLAGLGTNLCFFTAYGTARNNLYTYTGGHRRLRPGAVMEPFGDLVSWSLLGCWMAVAYMALLAWYYYAYHSRGSRSIYLMRRLRTPWELRRRCFSLPLLGVGLYALEALVLLVLDYAVYRLCTPAQCLPGLW